MVTSFTLVWIKMAHARAASAGFEVTSFTLVWIKIISSQRSDKSAWVTSFTLVWIKMIATIAALRFSSSHELHARVD